MSASYDVISTKYFSFFTDDNVSLIKQCLINYLNTGQKEFIRLTIRQFALFHLNDCIDFLYNLLVNGLPSNSICLYNLSQIHIMWMLYHEYLLLHSSSSSDIIHSYEIKRVSLYIQLDLIFINCISKLTMNSMLYELFKVFRLYYHSIVNILYPLSSNMIENLNEILENNILLFNNDILQQLEFIILQIPNESLSLLKRILIHDITTIENDVTYKLIQSNQIKFIYSILNVIEQYVVDIEHLYYIKLFELIPRFNILPNDCILKIDIIIENILKIIHPKQNNLSSNITNSILHDNQISFYNLLFSCSSIHIINRFEYCYDKYFINMYCNSNGNLHSSIFTETIVDNEFFSYYYQFIRIKNKHIFKYIIESSIELIKQEKYFALKKQLKYFKPLSPLILVYYWNHLSNNMSNLIQLIDICYIKPLSYNIVNGLLQTTTPIDAKLTGICCMLSHQVALSKWCSKRIWKHSKDKNLKYLKDIDVNVSTLSQNALYTISSRILNDLKENSLLYILYNTINMNDITLEDIMNIGGILQSDSPNTIQYKNNNLKEILPFCILIKYLQYNDISIFLNKFNLLEELDNITSYIKQFYNAISNIPIQIQLIEHLIGFLFNSYESNKPNTIISQKNEYLIIECQLSLFQELITKLESNTTNNKEQIQRINIIKQIINNGIWRLHLFQNFIEENKLFTKSIINIWNSSNESFLINFLKLKSFNLCKEIILHYKMDNNISSVSYNSELVHLIKQSIYDNTDWKIHFNNIDMNTTSGLLSSIDILTTINNNEIINYFIPIISESIQSNVYDNELKLCINRILTLYNDIKVSPFESILSISFGCNTNDLYPSEIELNNMSTLWKLYDIVNETKITDEQLNYITKQINSTESNQYFNELLIMINQMTKILYNDSNTYSLDFLTLTPDILIGKLIYKNDYTTADKLSKMFNINLIIGLLTSIKRENNSNENTVILTDPIVKFFNEKDSFLCQLICLYKHSIDIFPSSILNLINSITMNQNETIRNWISLKLLPYYYFSICYINLTSINEIGLLSELNSLNNITFPTSDSLSEEGEYVFSLLVSDEFISSTSIQNKFYTKIISRLIGLNNFTLALKIAEDFLPTRINDDILSIFISNYPTKAWKYILRLKNNQTAYSYTLKYMKQWKIDECIDILNMFKEYSKEDKNLPINQIKEMINELLIYKELMNISNKSWCDNNIEWVEISNICKENSDKVIIGLTNDKYFDLARQLSLLFSPNLLVKRTIEQEFIIAQMKSINVNEYSLVISPLLNRLGISSINISECIIDSFDSNIPNLIDYSEIEFKREIDFFIDIQLFIIQYIIRNCNDNKYLEQYTLEGLLKKQNGLKLLKLISIEIVNGYLHLSDYPELIIEGLIMAEQTTEVSILFQEYPQFRDDNLILYYCAKSMQLTNNIEVSQQISSHSSLRQIRRDFISVRHSEDTSRRYKKLTVIENEHIDKLKETICPFNGNTNDYKKREEFVYKSSPNIRLFKSLISLCVEYKIAGENCIDLANQLSIKALPTSTDPLFITDQIQQIILTAKYLLLEARLSSEICDRMISHLSLIQSLIIQKCDIFYSLLEFNNISKMNQLRDKLIKDDHIQLALDVCFKCHLDPSTVWASWGLSLLRMGDYTNAKDKFLKCLKEKQEISSQSNMDRRKRLRSLSIKNESQNQYRLVNDIVKILEIKPRNDSKTLRQIQRDSIRKRMMNVKTNNTKGNTQQNVTPKVKKIELNQMDTERYMQCMFYLTRFGATEDIISFWVRHSYYEDALRFILQKRLPPKLFIEVSMRVIHSRGVTYLFSILRKIDSKLEYKEYLLRFCAVLSSSKAEEVLLETQIYMGDNIRAGLTCVSKAKKVENNILLQVSHLELANKCLSTAIEMDQCRAIDSPLTESEVLELSRTVILQLDAIKIIISSFPNNIPSKIAKLSILTGDPNDISLLAETIISLNHFNVALKIIQEYSSIIDKQDILLNGALNITKSKRFTTLTEVLRLYRSTGCSEDEMNEIISECAILFSKQGDNKSSEKLVSKISTYDSRVKCNIKCGKLEKAFIDAAQANRTDLVHLVQTNAQRRNANSVYKMCAKYFKDKNF